MYNHEKDNSQEISSRIKQLRISMDYSQERLAEIVGITRSSLANYEQNRRPIPLTVLIKIADALSCSIDFLINGDKQNNDTDIMMIEKFDNIKNDFQRKLVRTVLDMTYEEIQVLQNFFNKIKDD